MDRAADPLTASVLYVFGKHMWLPSALSETADVG